MYHTCIPSVLTPYSAPSPPGAQALCSALEVPIEVFSAMSPPLLLGEQFEGPPLLLTYHEHYYALGAHYNSVVPSSS